MDLCRCASKGCPEYNNCIRGGATKVKPGEIFTSSYLAQICNESNGYESRITLEEYYGTGTDSE